jgi:REP element-mobilizing transposase RayT
MATPSQQPANAGRSPGGDEVDRWWLLTTTTYGTWLPGDRRGFVSPVSGDDGSWLLHNVPGTPYDTDHEGLRAHHRQRLLGPPVYLVHEQAVRLLEQFHETARYRERLLAAAAVMREHAHLVVGVIGDPEPSYLLGDFKAYGSRALNEQWGKPKSGTWWTEKGSTRKLKDDDAVLAAVAYVRDQRAPLALFVDPRFTARIGERPDPASGGH